MRSPKDFFKPLAVGAPAPRREIPFRPSRMIHFFPASNEKMRGKLPDDYPIGMLLQVTSTAKEDGSRFVMTATEINRNANMTINMSEYPPVTMGGK